MRVFDCFSYLDEDLLLDIRLNVLNEYVDYFVIIEGNKTWQNNNKKFKLDINKYSKFNKKIIYIKVKDLPDGDDPYLRENFQRNCILRGIKNAKENDLILISDLDEIPNLKNLKKINVKLLRYGVFKQKHFYYKLNLQSINNPYWFGSRFCIKKYLKSPQWLRELKFKKRPFWRIDKLRLNNIIENGGWHFCNLKKPIDLLYKYSNLCETNDPYHFKEKIDEKHLNLDEIERKIQLNKDIIGRKDNFEKIKIDESYPDYILKNISKYIDWIV
jgi:beta-1,4-mannosyl-glycoprotein beta-1,4-N-acetylglucosaminyltransferase